MCVYKIKREKGGRQGGWGGVGGETERQTDKRLRLRERNRQNGNSFDLICLSFECKRLAVIQGEAPINSHY